MLPARMPPEGAIENGPHDLATMDLTYSLKLTAILTAIGAE